MDVHGTDKRAAGLIALSVCLLVGCSVLDPPKTDAELEARFLENRELFERLAAMLEVDDELTVLEGQHFWPRDAISTSRREDYQGLLTRVGVTKLTRSEERSCTIHFLTPSAAGLAMSEYKGYARCDAAAPQLVLPDLDAAREDLEPQITVYRHLAGRWYLYYWWARH